MIGTAGSPEKLEVARRHGCDHVINYHEEDVAVRVKAITSGEGCHVVYDSVGKTTFPSSLDCLRPFGYFVSFGLRRELYRRSTSCFFSKRAPFTLRGRV